MDETAERIAAATFELHASIGPSNTTISAIAEHAGVQRLTVYRHYPDELSLFRACVHHGLQKHPMPDVAEWSGIKDPAERLRTGLLAMYRYYSGTAEVWSNILPDIGRIPALHEANADTFKRFGAIFQSLASGWGLRGARKRKLEAAIWLAIQFPTWQTIVGQRELSNEEAVEVMAGSAENSRSGR